MRRLPCAVHCQSNAGIHGLNPGNETNRYLALRRRQLKLLNALLLAVLSLAARGVDVASRALIGVPAGCLSLLLLASTAASAARQVRDAGGADVTLWAGALRGSWEHWHPRCVSSLLAGRIVGAGASAGSSVGDVRLRSVWRLPRHPCSRPTTLVAVNT